MEYSINFKINTNIKWMSELIIKSFIIRGQLPGSSFSKFFHYLLTVYSLLMLLFWVFTGIRETDCPHLLRRPTKVWWSTFYIYWLTWFITTLLFLDILMFLSALSIRITHVDKLRPQPRISPLQPWKEQTENACPRKKKGLTQPTKTAEVGT